MSPPRFLGASGVLVTLSGVTAFALIERLAFGATLVTVGSMILLANEIMRHLIPFEQAYRTGYDIGHQHGHAEGRRTARPVVVPIRCPSCGEPIASVRHVTSPAAS